MDTLSRYAVEKADTADNIVFITRTKLVLQQNQMALLKTDISQRE